MKEPEDLIARTMVENLSVEINPLTGEALQSEDCCANEIVQEALKIVLEHCTLESYATIVERRKKEKEQAAKERKARQDAQDPNVGKPWTPEETQDLCLMYCRKGKNIYQIAHILKRTPGSVSYQLRKLGYLK